jgi:clorobiocin biosynthesis protein CloN3
VDFDIPVMTKKLYDDIVTGVAEQLRRVPPTTPDDHFGRADWETAARLGLTGLCLPAAYGGGELGALDTALCLEAFGRACADTGLVFGVAAHLLACAVPIRDFGTEELHEELLPGLVDGDLIAANAMTEHDAGSDVGHLGMTARPVDGGYLLSGQKSFASNAPLADVFVTYAVTDAEAGFLGLTAFAVPRNSAGLTVGPPMHKMGLHGCPAGEVTFTDCFVPTRYRIGREGQGSVIFQHSMGWERGCLFGLYVGLMDAQLHRCVDHARQRSQFGHAIGGFQAISHKVAVMKQRLEAARLLLYRACWLIDQGRADHVTAVALSKVAVSEAAVANGIDAVQIFGGSGYLVPTGIERQLRDSVPSTIFSGTTEIQRELISREIGL